MSNKKSICSSNTFIMIVAALLIAINVLTALLPLRYTHFDISSNNIYSISKESKRFLKALDSNIQIFVINSDASNPYIEHTLSLFEEYSDKLKIEYSIPDEELAAMGVDNIDDVPQYTLVVKGKYRTNYILQSDMYFYTNDTYYDILGKMSTSDYYSIQQTLYEYAYLNEYYQQMLYSLITETKTHFDLESILLERIEYVSTENIPHPYYITGHGEPSITESVLGANLALFGCEVLDLSSAEFLPVDVASLVISTPKSDYSDKETNIISEYLANGGSLVLITSPENAGMPNLMSIVEKYGASTAANLIYIERTDEESDQEASADEETTTESTEDLSEYEKYQLIPTINEDHDSIYELAGQYPYIFKANHIEISESKPTVVIEKLLTVADAQIEGIENSQGDKTIAVAIEDSTDNGITQILWFTGGESFSDDMITEINFYLIAYSLNWCSKTFESQIPDIQAKTTTEEIFAPAELAYYGLPILFAIVIPAAIIFAGTIIIRKRKTRKQIEE